MRAFEKTSHVKIIMNLLINAEAWPLPGKLNIAFGVVAPTVLPMQPNDLSWKVIKHEGGITL